MNKSALLLIAYLVVGALSVECPKLEASNPDYADILKELQPTSEEGAGKENVVKLIYTHNVATISKKTASARIVRHKTDDSQALHEYEIEQLIASLDNPLESATPHYFAHSYGCWAHGIYYYTATQATGGHMDEDKERNHFLDCSPAEQAATLDKMASALLALHLAGVLHCNVQPKMFGRLDGSITIFNFKKAIKQGSGFCTKAESGYAAPELFKSDLSQIKNVQQKFSAADYFSFGIGLIDMIDNAKVKDEEKDKERASKTLLDKSNVEKNYADQDFISGVIDSKFGVIMTEAEKLEKNQLKAQRIFFLTQMKTVVSGLTKFKIEERKTLLDMFPAIHCTSAALEQAKANNFDEMSKKLTEVFNSCTSVLESKKSSMSTPIALTDAMKKVKTDHNFLI